MKFSFYAMKSIKFNPFILHQLHSHIPFSWSEPFKFIPIKLTLTKYYPLFLYILEFLQISHGFYAAT